MCVVANGTNRIKRRIGNFVSGGGIFAVKVVDWHTVASSGNLFSNAAWYHVLEDCYGFGFHGLMTSDGVPVFIFAVINDIYGERIIIAPFSDYISVSVNEDLLLGALDFLKYQYPSHAIIIKLLGLYDGFFAKGFKTIRSGICHRIPLNCDEDLAWERTGRAFKKGVRKAERCGVCVQTMNSLSGVDIFYDMLTNLRLEKFNILPQPKKFYLLLFKYFVEPKNGNIWVAFYDEKPVASAFVLHSSEGMFDKMGVSNLDSLNIRPNNALLWEVIKYGITNRFSFLDMGLSPISHEGLIRFKDSMGSSRFPINYFRYDGKAYNDNRDDEIKHLLSNVTDFIVSLNLQQSDIDRAASILYKFFC